MLCWFLLYSITKSVISIHKSLCVSLPPLPTSHLYRSSHSARAIYLTHGSIYVLMLLSPFIPLSPSPTVSTSPLSTSAAPFLPCKQVHQYRFSGSHIYTHYYVIFIFLFLTSLCVTGSRFIHLTTTDLNLFLFMAE